ncbi:hypothetical protein Tco_1107185 [Tanacetum coccineum]
MQEEIGVARERSTGAVLDEEQFVVLAGEQVNQTFDDVDDSTSNDLALNVDHIFEDDEGEALQLVVDEGPNFN